MKKLLLLSLLCPFFLIAQTQIGQVIDGEATGDNSGRSVSLSSDGSIVAIGANRNAGNGSLSGHVRVYSNTGGVWTQVGQDIDGEATSDFSGTSVSLSSDGSIVAIAAQLNDGNGSNSGHVRIYSNIGGVWTQVGQDINGEAAGDWIMSVSLSSDGSVLAIGAINNDGVNGSDSGHVRIYSNTGGVWSQVGQDIDGEATFDRSGSSISLSSDGFIVAIGARGNGSNGENSGHVRIYSNTGGLWTQLGQDIDGDSQWSLSGTSVSLSSDGSIVAIGAVGDSDAASYAGHVRIYSNTGGVWTQVGQDIDGEAVFDDLSGASVSLSSDGSIVAIGAVGSDTSANTSGRVRIYRNTGGVWTQVGQDIDGEAAGDLSGSSVSLSSDGSVVAIGAPSNNGNGEDSGHVRVYDLSAVLSTESFNVDYFSYFPNPVKDELSLSLNSGLELKQVNVYNNLGQYLYSTKTATINTSNLNSGLYFIEVETDQGKSTKKIIKE